MTGELKSIIDHYGKESQVLMAIEEISELTKELCKDHRGKDNRQEIIEEIADVELMLDQLKIMFNVNQMTVDYIKGQKIKRTLERCKHDSE